MTDNPEHLRRIFHEEIDRMPAPRLALLRRVLLQLAVVEAAEQLDRDFDADAAAGRLSPDRIDGAIRAARAARA